MLAVYETVSIRESTSRLLSMKIIQELSGTVQRLSSQMEAPSMVLPRASMYQKKQYQLTI
jgi:hypothetical protein